MLPLSITNKQGDGPVGVTLTATSTDPVSGGNNGMQEPQWHKKDLVSCIALDCILQAGRSEWKGAALVHV